MQRNAAQHPNKPDYRPASQLAAATNQQYIKAASSACQAEERNVDAMKGVRKRTEERALTKR